MKVRSIWVLSLAGIVVGSLAWWALQPREPFAQGKRLSVWITERYLATGGNGVDEAIIRQMGTNALPSLLKLAAARPSPMQTALQEHVSREHWQAWDLDSAWNGHWAAAWGFHALGPTARPALPTLIKLLDDKDADVRSTAAACIAAIGVPAKEAIPALLRGLNEKTDADTLLLRMNCARALGVMGETAQAAISDLTALKDDLTVGFEARVALLKIKHESISPIIDELGDVSKPGWGYNAMMVGAFGADAEAAIPSLLRALNPSNKDAVLGEAATALGRIGRRPELCVPALVPLLSSTNSSVREASIAAIRKFGTNAAMAIPAVRQCLADPAWRIRNHATNALLEIVPATAEKIPGMGGQPAH